MEDRSKLLERVAGLSDEQRADLMRRLVHRAQGKPDEVPRVSRTTEIPLSYAQERLWLTAQMAPESPAYHLPSALRLRGRLDPEALRRAVEQVLRRHEAEHVAQARRVGLVRFYATYLWDWLGGLVRTGSPDEAYRQIRWEVEAYAAQRDPGWPPECADLQRPPDAARPS